MPTSHPPTPGLTVFETVMLIAGVVIGAGIFALPSLVAANTGTPVRFYGAWVLGGLVSLAGALCYAELATTYPHAGGEHHFLRRAFGEHVGFLFAWSRLAVLQTGSIAIQAFIVGDYAARLAPSLPYLSGVIAAVTVIALTAVNLLGFRQGKGTQAVLGFATCAALVAVGVTGLFGPAAAVEGASAAATAGSPAFGLALVFVLLAFGGWNEAAYISADVSRRNMVRGLLWGIGTVTAIYLLVNFAYLRGLGLGGIAGSSAVAADLVQRALGPGMAALTSAAIMVAALSTANATTITGGRSHYALGQHVPLLSWLGHPGQGGSPRPALIVQGAIALLLVVFGAATRKGFTALVEYTAPVFWFFFFLVGVSLFVLRAKDPARERPFRVPLFPLTPLLFCGVCLWMIRSSLAHTGVGALVGVVVLISGLPILWFGRARADTASPFAKPERSS